MFVMLYRTMCLDPIRQNKETTRVYVYRGLSGNSPKEYMATIYDIIWQASLHGVP